MIPRAASHVETLFQLYLAAETLSRDERSSFLDRQRLSSADRALIDGMFESAAASAQVDAWLTSEPSEPPTLAPGTEIGVYRIERLIDRGGQGTVYLASHARAEVDRQVAIKLPRRVAGDALLGARREARMLSRLDHQAIARFLSVDHTADGRVFLVMEYVDGTPLDAALAGASVDRVLAVFAELGDALNHAHQQGIAHLDLKPSNVFVDRTGQPKILDFGLGLLYTREAPTGPAHGFTRPYAAPEQLAGEGSAACDTFTLGLILLQVLIGTPPAQLRERAAAFDPDRRVRGKAALGRDLSAIVSRACADDPHRRYSSIAQFAADLRAVLAVEPVSARRWTWRYALSCLVRRRPLAAAAAAAAVLMLSAAVAGLVVQRTRLIEAQAQASRDAERSRVALGIVVSAMEAAEPESTPQITDAERALVERLRRAAAKADDPAVRATADLVVARIARGSGDSETALAVLDRVVDQAGRDGDVDLLAEALINQVDAYAELARFEQADTALDRLRGLPGGYGGRADVLRAEGRRLIRAGKFDDAEAALRRGIAAAGDDTLRVKLMNDLGTILNDHGRYADAVALFEAQRPLVEAVFGPVSVSYGVNAHNRSLSYYGVTRLDDARKAVKEAEDIFTQRLGAQSLRNADALLLEAIVVLNDDSSRAVECLEQAIAIYRVSYGADHPKVAQALYTLGQLHLDDGDAGKAAQEFDAAASIAAARLEAGHPLVATLMQARGSAQLALGHPAAALPLLESSLAAFRVISAEPDITKAIVQNDLSQAYRLLGRAADSEAASRYAYDVAAASLPEGTIERALFAMERAASLASASRLDEARVLFGQARASFDAQAARPAARKARPRLDTIGTYIEQRSPRRSAASRGRDAAA